MNILCEKRENGTLLTVSGRMDAVSAPEFEKECIGIIKDGAQTIVVDLAQLEYISSAGLRSILASAKKAQSASCTLRFCCLSGMVEEVFQISGLTSMFILVSTVEEAFEA